MPQENSRPIECGNFVSGRWSVSAERTSEIRSPYTGQLIGKLHLSGAKEVEEAVTTAARAAAEWRRVSVKERCQILMKFRDVLLRDLELLAASASRECGKTPAEARAGVLKGIEVLEFATSLQNLDQGGKMEVSRGVSCEYRREPLGVVAGITPFNFPAMVPMWMIPIAIAVGNAFIWKPSDKTPLTSIPLANAAKEAGIPDGILTVVQGDREAVEAILDHPGVAAAGFVGSSPVARAVYLRGTSKGKRVLALGGAKNHIILMPDADPEMAARGITDSYTGCAGQRCMAASVLLAVGDCDPVLSEVVANSGRIRIGQDMGAIVSRASLAKLISAIDRAAAEGAKILLDGRAVQPPEQFKGGNWLGPTILDQVSPGSEAARDELFGPVLSVIRVPTLSDALAVQGKSPFGNAASVFTSNGAIATRVAEESHAGMVGINIGVPVPREPFSFGGIGESRFGHGDITGPEGVSFWSSLKKVTTKWVQAQDRNWMS